MITQDIPNAVTSQQDELPVGVDLFDNDIGVRRDDLIFRGQPVVGFEREIAQSSTQSQVSVDTIELHETSGVFDPFPLFFIAGFVIYGQGEGGPVDGGDTSAVPGVVGVECGASESWRERMEVGLLFELEIV